MARLAILIDGAYLESIARTELNARVNYEDLPTIVRDIVAADLVEPLDLLRTYYFNALPYKSARPTPEETTRFSAATRFHDFLRRLPKFEVREGWLAYRGNDSKNKPIFQQKQVDMLLGLDIALLSAKRLITHMAVISGDSGLTPAVDVARDEGVVVWLFHGPTGKQGGDNTVAQSLLDHADMRYEMDSNFMNRVRRWARNQ